MKLRQSQIWKVGTQYIRIVSLERLAVGYKSMKHLDAKEGTHHQVTKKEFCTLIKKAELINPQASQKAEAA